MHRTFIGHLETGRKDFRLTMLSRVAEALDVPLAELFSGIETGEKVKASPKVPAPATNRYGLLKEISVLEGTVERLKGLADVTGGPVKAPAKKK